VERWQLAWSRFGKRFVYSNKFNILIGEYFWNNGDKYEGEFKDGQENGQGKKRDLFILT
jgi:hypothetical protein